MSKLVRRQPYALLADLPEWFESFPSLASWRGLAEFQDFRLEGYTEDGCYVVRAELPGIDPEKDLEITVRDGVLTIGAERSEEKTDKDRSEFRYGALHRALRLPAGAREDDVAAEYRNGILTVRIPIGEVEAPVKRISVKRAD